jgi:hypothetical protein
MDDPDVIQLVDSIVEFANLNRKFVSESNRFEIFLHNINKYYVVFKDERKMSDTNISYVIQSNMPGLINQNNNENLLNKLNDIESKLANFMESKNSNTTPIKIFNKNVSQLPQVELQKMTTSEFCIFSPKKIENKNENFSVDANLSDMLLINSENSFFAVSDPSDEYSVLNLIESYLNFEDKFDKVLLRKVINWRKRILEISKRNGWIVGKILAANTIKNFEFDDRDIIKANLIFMEKYSLFDKDNLKLDYKDVLKEYEDLLINSLNEM